MTLIIAMHLDVMRMPSLSLRDVWSFSMVAFVFPTPGSLKRVVKVEDAIAVSIKQWRELPRKYFLSAWVKTGYFTMETLMAETNLTAEELETDPCHR